MAKYNVPSLALQGKEEVALFFALGWHPAATWELGICELVFSSGAFQSRLSQPVLDSLQYIQNLLNVGCLEVDSALCMQPHQC